MKQYLLFSGEQYEENGGWWDLVGSYESVDAAKDAANVSDSYRWAHIVNTDCGTGDVLTWQHAVTSAVYPDLPNLPSGWFTEAELAERETARLAARNARRR